jgi:hypothetical protein
MGDNKKPILSVLVDEDKKRLFADLARAHNYSMGWLLNQAIDKMLEAGTIHIYRDSVPPIDGVAPNPLPSTDIEDVVRKYVDKATSSMADELLNLQTKLAELTIDRDNWDDLRADVADLREQLAQLTTTAKKPQPLATKAASTTGETNPEIRKVAARLEKEPKLKARVAEGVNQGLTGSALGQWLADGGFLNKNGGVYEGASNSRFRLAIEYLNNADKPDGK